MENQQRFSLQDDLRESTSRYDRLIERFLCDAMITLFYLGSLTLGLCCYPLFVQSPLLRFVGRCAGFLAASVSWIPGFLVGGLVLGRFDFARQVFNLHAHGDFCIAMGLIFLSIPIGLLLIKVMVRLAHPLLFWSSVLGSVICFSLSVEYINLLSNKVAYVSACSLIGGIYYLIMKRN